MESGHRLGPYTLEERIGAGGMGEVHRARDAKLDRDVAIKVLPRDLADNPVRLARLEREAKVVAALSHPNVLAVYDFGVQDGTAYVVTELLEGETLRERLAAGALTPRKAAEYGRQVARGLAAAHDKGIVHRDLKPENLFLTREGRIKILDFGLATAAADAGATGAADATSDVATRTKLTAAGTVLGTVDYMSPEQVRGEPTDSRSDLFSFGSVLYEMVAGARPFHRETGAETMAAILKDEPADVAVAAPDVPPALAAIIRRCLEKRPGERFHSAHDLAFSLEALSGSTVTSGATAALEGVAPPRRRPGPGVVAILVVAALAAGALGSWFLRPQPSPEVGIRYTALSSRRGTVTNARFTSTDGAAVYSATWAGAPLRLYPAAPGVRTSEPLNLEDADLLGVSSTGELAVSLDRRHTLGWEAIGTLAVAEPGGAAPRPVLENVLAADWAPDGRTLAVAHEVDGVVRLEYPIGTVLYESPGWIDEVRVHPDGERVLIADCPGRGDNQSIVRIVHRDGRVETLTRAGSWGLLWTPDGRSALVSDGGNVYRVRPGGDPVWLTGMPSALRLMDITDSGLVLATAAGIRREMFGRAPGADAERDLSWLDWSTPTLISDDGRLAVFEEGNDFDADGYGLYLRGTDGTPPLRLGTGSAVALSPDGAWLALLKRPFADDSQLMLMPTGPGTPRPVDRQGLRMANNRGFWVSGQDGGPGSLVVLARSGDGPLQLFELPLSGGAARAVTPADLPLAPHGHCVASDGGLVVARPSDGTAVAFGLDGDGPRALPGVLPTDLPVVLDRDGRHLYVQAALTVPSPVYRVDLATGERTLWRELAPPDPAGVFIVDRLRISTDGAAYVYSIRRQLSQLVLVEGLD